MTLDVHVQALILPTLGREPCTSMHDMVDCGSACLPDWYGNDRVGGIWSEGLCLWMYMYELSS